MCRIAQVCARQLSVPRKFRDVGLGLLERNNLEVLSARLRDCVCRVAVTRNDGFGFGGQRKLSNSPGRAGYDVTGRTLLGAFGRRITNNVVCKQPPMLNSDNNNRTADSHCLDKLELRRC